MMAAGDGMILQGVRGGGMSRHLDPRNVGLRYVKSYPLDFYKLSKVQNYSKYTL